MAEEKEDFNLSELATKETWNVFSGLEQQKNGSLRPYWHAALGAVTFSKFKSELEAWRYIARTMQDLTRSLVDELKAIKNPPRKPSVLDRVCLVCNGHLDHDEPDMEFLTSNGTDQAVCHTACLPNIPAPWHIEFGEEGRMCLDWHCDGFIVVDPVTDVLTCNTCDRKYGEAPQDPNGPFSEG